MAIKISNTIVLDDSRDIANGNSATFTGNGFVKLSSGNTAQRPVTATNGMLRYNTDEETFEGYVDGAWGPIGGDVEIVLTPTNVSPANGSVDVANTNLLLEGSPYYHLYGKEKANGQWQISTSNTFGTTVVDEVVSGNSVTYTVTTQLLNQNYYWRVRYQDSDGIFSQYSTPTIFDTDGPDPPPTTLGDAYQGGYYTGVIDIGGGVCYYLIVAPNATGCACCQWKTTRTATSGTGSCVNGYTNTRSPMENATHPAGNWTATRTIGGFSDWYLPARDELNIMYTNKGSMPAGEGFAAASYWSSTENNATGACSQSFSNGSIGGSYGKTFFLRVRAVRRSPI
jgi:hypothetical protein